jgi:hypothetical protein
MNNFFVYNNATSTLEFDEPTILLVSEFAKLMELDRNKCTEDPKGTLRKRAFRELTYIYLAINWRSPYADYSEQERHQEALRDANLTEEEFNDPIFRAACRKYREIQNSTRSIKVLQAAQNTVDKFIDYFNNIDPEERDPQTGKPIYKVKDIMAEISSLDKVLEELKTLTDQVKKDISAKSKIRAGATEGFMPTY